MQTITRVPAMAAPIQPKLTERASYSRTSASANVVHPIVGRSDVEATLRPAGLAAGTLTLIFPSRATAFAAEAAHRAVGIFTLTDTDVPEASMSYIVQGQIVLSLPPGGSLWQLAVGFQQVLP